MYLPSVVGMATGSNSNPYYNVSGYNGTDVTEAKSIGNFTTYGVLYNWAAAKQDVCPSGWHLPTDDDWTELTEFLGGADTAGGKLKSVGYTLWNDPNTGATNESDFNGLPGDTAMPCFMNWDITDIGGRQPKTVPEQHGHDI